MQDAPLFHEITKGPADGKAYWVTASDGVRLRVGHWPANMVADNGGAEKAAPSRGTVLLFPGRTEYIEKYGLIASELCADGYHVLIIDWRGQGLADRPDQDRELGHVGHFDEYQLDVDAMVDLGRHLKLPEPWTLLGHSMGGCIGLRALHNGLPVKAALFSAPMWGIEMAPPLRPIAWGVSWALHKTPLAMALSPGTKRETYLSISPFKDNLLTTDSEMYGYMADQAKAHPELTLGGPTLGWLYAALRETQDLMSRPAPATPTVTFLGTQERIVKTEPIHTQMAKWSNGDLVLVQGAEHEVLMEAKAIRQQVYDALHGLQNGAPKGTPVFA